MDSVPISDKVEYQVPASISPAEAADLYVKASWLKSPDSAAVEAMLKGTFAVSAAFVNGHLIGFMRALSDGVSDAYLLDLIVAEEYRKHGIGRRIYENLANYLASLGIDWITFIGAPGTEEFYARTKAGIMQSYTPYRYPVQKGEIS